MGILLLSIVLDVSAIGPEAVTLLGFWGRLRGTAGRMTWICPHTGDPSCVQPGFLSGVAAMTRRHHKANVGLRLIRLLVTTLCQTS